MLRLGVALMVLALAALGCSGDRPPSPFARDAGVDGPQLDAPDAALDDAPRDTSDEDDPTLGGPCVDDEQCDDGVECTSDRCDTALSRCRFTPDHGACADTIFCDGEEVCDPRLGCREGEPEACSDGRLCTIDTCLEATRSCKHDPRDADGDGEAVWNCPGGSDCDDTDPRIFSGAPEVCQNGRDDDCDNQIDEPDGCVSPPHDSCVDPLVIEGSGSFSLPLAGAKSDYSATCAGSGGQWRDAVVALSVPPGPNVDIDVTASAAFAQIALASLALCGDPASESACVEGVSPVTGGALARLKLRNLAAGNHALYVFSTSDSDVVLKVQYAPPEPKPANETCGTAQPISVLAHVSVPVIDASKDLSSACDAATGELVYRFDLDTPRDVRAYAASLDGVGLPAISLRGPGCSAPADELTCSTSQTPQVFARNLPPGRYYLSVAASAPTDVDLVLETHAPTTAPADETCDAAPPLQPNRTSDVSLSGHTDDVRLGCLVGAVDAAYSLELSDLSDVLLIERISSGDVGAVSLLRPPCQASTDLLECGTAVDSPVRALARGVEPGSYRVVVESSQASPTTLTALVRPSVSPTLVAFADTCAAAIAMPPAGGFFQGNTANASADYGAGCDLGGQAPAGAPDQMLKLELSAPKRVVFDMRGSEYQTLLDIRRGPSCPGTEVLNGCAAGYVRDKSYLDLVLPAGQYFVQVDGYAGAQGPWVLDVFVADP